MSEATLKALFARQPVVAEDALPAGGGGLSHQALVRLLRRGQRQGRLERLGRGLYASTAPQGAMPVQEMWLANRLRAPSYVTDLYAMSMYNMLPETVYGVTSVTTGKASEVENRFGRYSYAHLEPRFYWGYKTVYFAPLLPYRIAHPEKALLDYLWLRPDRAWCTQWLAAELRLRFSENFNVRRFVAYARGFRSERMLRCADIAMQVMIEEAQGWEPPEPILQRLGPWQNALSPALPCSRGILPSSGL